MERREITRAVQRLVLAATLKGDPRSSNWQKASWPLSQTEGDLIALAKSRSLTRLPAVDNVLCDFIVALSEGDSTLLAELEGGIPDGLFEVASLRGLGAKKVKQLWDELGVTSLGELECAIQENRLLSLSGFGKKTQAKIAEQLGLVKSRKKWKRRDDAKAIYDEALSLIGDTKAVIAGSYRRGEELIDAFPLVVFGALDEHIKNALADLGVTAIEAQNAWALTEATGPRAHMKALKARAEQLSVDHTRFEIESELYDALGLHFCPPERRSELLVHRGSVVWLWSAPLRSWSVTSFTFAESDGKDSPEVMQNAAAAMGLEYLGISDHSETAAYARGLTPERLLKQARAIAALPEHACTLLSGVESDILKGGQLDYDDELLRELDVVIASVHQRYGQSGAEMTARMSKAARHPLTNIIGHPTGRLLLSRPESGVDVETLLSACAEAGTAIELNANPHRLDLSVENTALAKSMGVLVSIGADAHSIAALANLEHGVAVARRAGLTPEDVLNARTLHELRTWLSRKRAKSV